MIPYFAQPAWHVGPLTIHAFGVAVAVAMWVGLTLGQQRFARPGLDPVVGNRLGTWVLAGGFLGAHLFSVLAYFPHKLLSDPWLLLRVWEDISSFGGMLGGALGALLFFSFRFRDATWQTRLSYLDAIVFAFVPALAIGRIGCALAHDHPGSVTSFPLAISLESPGAQSFIRDVYANAGLTLPANVASLGFHDLGLYELVILAAFIIPAMAYWSRRGRPAGFYLAGFATLYMPMRFGLDALRVADARYLGLTPAQWGAASALALLPLIALGRRRARFAISGAVILATAWACWSGQTPN